mmetsp:Transcript_36809/g.65918  ORF Transcript_36809/g.65918 Transcript_36809/m.65918 type:complete len:81 (+) Transcript_36809:1790-2032(+)
MHSGRCQARARMDGITLVVPKWASMLLSSITRILYHDYFVPSQSFDSSRDVNGMYQSGPKPACARAASLKGGCSGRKQAS